MIAALAILALAIISQAVVHRARAHTAADAVALAAVSDQAAGDQLATWYGTRGVVVTQTESGAIAASGPSQGAAWAALTPTEANRSPALVAMIARAEQLVGGVFTSAQWSTFSVTVDATDGEGLGTVAAELGLCEDIQTSPHGGEHTFTLFFCSWRALESGEIVEAPGVRPIWLAARRTLAGCGRQGTNDDGRRRDF